MIGNQKVNHGEKHPFKGNSYCPNCQQKKSCGVLDEEKRYCCPCLRKIWEKLEGEQLLVDSAQQVLNDYRQRKVICYCLESEKPRVKHTNSDGSGGNRCESCEEIIRGAGHHGTIKNRNNPNFGGIKSEWKILCLKCLGKKFYNQLDPSKRKTFNKYVKRDYE